MPCEERSNGSHIQSSRSLRHLSSFRPLADKISPLFLFLCFRIFGSKMLQKKIFILFGFCSLEHKCKDISLVCGPGDTQTQIQTTSPCPDAHVTREQRPRHHPSPSSGFSCQIRCIRAVLRITREMYKPLNYHVLLFAGVFMQQKSILWLLALFFCRLQSFFTTTGGKLIFLD